MITKIYLVKKKLTINDFEGFSREELDFEGFSREELDFNSDIEVQKNTVQ